MATPIRNFDKLEQRLSLIKPPPDGYTRVYRGQTADFGMMLASGLRPDTRQRKHLWATALRSLAANLSASGGLGSGIELITAMGYWFDVLAQHYGPGSTFLDVTHAPEVAIWFALHSGHETNTARLSLSQHGAPFPIELPRLYFAPHQEGTAWFYVLDVPVWDGQSVPGHGDLVDLASAPDYISDSPRVQRQQGCLIAAESDLSDFYACSPIAVAHPFAGCEVLERDYTYLFPDPEEDEWYARLLRSPLVPQVGEDGDVVYGQSLGVYFIVPDAGTEHAEHLIARQTQYLQPLARPVMRNAAGIDEIEDFMGASAEEATYVQLESPLMRTLPPAAVWNESLLMEGLRPHSHLAETTTGDPLDPVPLDNVLLEFSPLEWSFRETPADIGHSQVQWRGIWIARKGNDIVRALLATSGEDQGFLLARVRFNTAIGRFLVIESGRKPFSQSADPTAQPLYTALYLLRDLSRSFKPDVYPRLVRGGHTAIVRLRAQSARLIRSARDPAGLRLHFVRYVNNQASYEGPSPMRSYISELQVDVTTPYSELNGIEQVYGRVRKAQLSPGKIVHLPAPDESRHSGGAASQLLAWFTPDLGKVDPT